MFIIWKTDYSLGIYRYLYKSDLHIFTAGKYVEIIRIKHV